MGDWENQEGQCCIQTHCSGEGREKREGKCLCGGNHITSLLCVREERKKF